MTAIGAAANHEAAASQSKACPELAEGDLPHVSRKFALSS
jgi:hypothetical protein